MTKIGIFSDIHLDHAPWFFDPDPTVDLYINAGDTASDDLLKDYFIDKVIPGQFWIDGNHDYYDKVPRKPETYCKSMEINGLLIAGAPMWTDLSNPLRWWNYTNGLIDVKYIPGWTHEVYQEHFNVQSEFLLNSGADIIVSHHLPSWQSIHPKYHGSDVNDSFATELGRVILAMNKPPKLWIHGHTHDPCEYNLGKTRVICNPRGYPQERNFKHYQPVIVTL